MYEADYLPMVVVVSAPNSANITHNVAETVRIRNWAQAE